MYYSREYSKITGVYIEYIPHAIDINRLLTNKTKDIICNSLNLDKHKKIILLPSRLEPIQKQPMLFMKAFAKLDSITKEKYLIVCTGLDKQYIPYAEEIKEFCLKNNINIKLLRFDSMADAYKVTTLVILPSQSESFGYSALESLSLGIPTVLNNIPTYSEIAHGSKNSYIFNLTVESLYELLKSIISKTNLRIEQSEVWNSRYNVQLFAKRYLTLLEK